MRVLTLLGSPRHAGNTAHVLDWVEQSLRENGHQVERVTLIDFKIGPCLECLACRRASGQCANHMDDANEILQQIVRADAVLIATPVFCWGFPSHLKALLDRMYALVDDYEANPEYASRIAHKPAGLLVTCAGPEEGDGEFVIRAFNALTQFMKADSRGHLLYPFFRRPEDLTPEDRSRASQFAAHLVAAG